jgi:hypothetical protein
MIEKVAAIGLHAANDSCRSECELPARPQSWTGWRVAIEPQIWLTEHNWVGDFFDRYTVDTLDEAMARFFDERHDDLVIYRCHALDVIPAFEWYAEWPLLRRGKSGGFVRRQPRRGAVPWELVADDTLFELARRPEGPLGFTWTYLLSVGGRSQEEALANWMFWARFFRRARRRSLQRPVVSIHAR